MTSWLLGLDVGTDSIGWAAFRCADAPEAPLAVGFLDGGVRLFDSGRDPKKQTSYQRECGLKRRTRRQPRARRWRLGELRQALLTGGISPGNRAVTATPYELREKAVKAALPAEELWAALLHMAGHRGFRSNRMSRAAAEAPAKAAAPRPKDEDEDAGFWQQAEETLRRRMADAGVDTIGCLLAADLRAGRPVRMRYNRRGEGDACAPTRALVAEELDLIIARQRPAWPAVDWARVRSLVVDQRPLRSKGGGPCEFFPEEHRTWRALPSAQDFLVRQTLSNLRLPLTPGETRPLTPEEYDTALGLLSGQRSMEWSKLRSAIGLKGTPFTVERGTAGKRAAQRVEGNQADAVLGPLVPGWASLSLFERDALFEALWSERQDRARLLAAIADPEGPLAGGDGADAQAIADAIQFDLPTGRLGLSKKAARLIAQYLQPGVPVHEAIKSATGRDHSDRRPDTRLPRLPYYAEVMPDVGLDGSHDPADRASPERYFGRVANISVHIALNEIAKVVNALIDRYGAGPRLIAVETTRELKAGADERKRLLREQGKREAENAAIDAELRKTDRWLSNARERRRRWRLAKRQAGICPYSGERLSGADLLTDAYEIDHVIPRAMGGRDVEDNMVLCLAAANRDKGNRTPWQAFHQTPGWLAIRDRFLAGLDAPTRKALEWRFSDKAAERAAKLAKGEQPDDGEGFLPRQLTDTGYIARTALRYLLHVVPDQPRNGVVASRGSLTAWLRAAWQVAPEERGRDLLGLSRRDLGDDETAKAAIGRLEPAHLRKAVQSLVDGRLRELKKTVTDAGLADAALSVLYDAAGRKNRADHRHHFLDAAVIAVTERSLLQRISTLHGRLEGLPDPRDMDLPEPFPGYRAAVLRAHAHLWPSYRPQRDDGGALHAETLYGVRDAVRDGQPIRMLTVRKPVAALFLDTAGKPLADDKVAKVLESFVSERMRERFGKAVDAARQRLPGKTLAELCLAAAADPQWGPRGLTGNTVVDGPMPPSGVVWPFRGNPKAAVKTDGNAVYEVWEVRDGKGKVKWLPRVLTRFDMANAGLTAPPPPTGARRVMALRRGDLVWWPGLEGDGLFLVKKMDVTRGRLYLWPARYATGIAVADAVQVAFPRLNLNADGGYEVSTADALRKAGIRPATVSILGRLRVRGG